jgi:hypothetical protein
MIRHTVRLDEWGSTLLEVSALQHMLLEVHEVAEKTCSRVRTLSEQFSPNVAIVDQGLHEEFPESVFYWQ